MRLPTASELPRSMKCVASAVLPRVDSEDDRSSTHGRAVHFYFEDISKSGAGDLLEYAVESLANLKRVSAKEGATAEEKDEAAIRNIDAWGMFEEARQDCLSRVPRESLSICEAIPLESESIRKTLSSKFLHEVAFEYDVAQKTCSTLPEVSGRAYPYRSLCLYGMADIVSVTGDAVYVGDYKSGTGMYLDKVKDNWQLRFLAMAAAKAFGKTKAIIEICHVGGKSPKTERHEMDAFELCEVEEAINELVSSMQKAALSAVPRSCYSAGKHCRYCPCLRHCELKNNLLNSLCAMIDKGEEGKPKITKSNAARAHDWIRDASQLIDLVKQDLTNFVGTFHGGIEYEDGTTFESVEMSRARMDGRKALEVMQQMMPDFANEGVEISATVETLKRAARLHVAQQKRLGVKETIDGVVDKVRSAVAERDGLKVSTSNVLKQRAKKK